MKRLILKDLVEWKEAKKRKPLILTGVRQVGKTYILKEFGAHHFLAHHYVNFEKEPHLFKLFEENLKPERIIEELSFYLDTPIDIQNDLVIFDEIQACPKALTSLKYFHEDMPSLALCGAGSLLGVHLGPVSFPVGKVSLLNLSPMSFVEFLMAIDEERSLKALESQQISELVHEHLWHLLKHYFIVGGMPEAVQTYCDHKESLYEAFTKVRETQDNLLAAYFGDMAKHAGKTNAMHIDRVFRSIPTQLEKQMEGGAAKFKFKGVVPGITHYQRLASAIDWLVAAGLAIKVHIVGSGEVPLYAHSKENAFKLLLFDIGMLGSMSGLSPKAILDYDYGSYKGYFAENFVAQELLGSMNKPLFSWVEKNAEVEFLIEIEGEVIPLEVKAGKVTKTKSLHQFAEKYHPKNQVILSARSLSTTGTKRYYPLYLAGLLPQMFNPSL